MLFRSNRSDVCQCNPIGHRNHEAARGKCCRHCEISVVNGYHRKKIELDAVYSGFLGSATQVDAINRLYREHPDALRVVDPVMGDGGQKYPTYTDEMCEATAQLVDGADLLTPNLTEASILTHIPYQGQDASEAYVERVLRDRKSVV